MAYHTGTQKKPFGESLMEMMVRVFVIAAFLLFVTPVFIAPLLGVTPEQFVANELTWTLVSLALGWIVSIPVARVSVNSIKKGGGNI